jgi:hypothetical protein
VLNEQKRDKLPTRTLAAQHVERLPRVHRHGHGAGDGFPAARFSSRAFAGAAVGRGHCVGIIHWPVGIISCCAEKVRLEAASSKRPPKNHRRLQTSTRYNRLCGIRRHGHTDGSPLLAMSTSTAPAAWAAGVAYRFRSILSFRPLPFDVPSGFGFCDSAGDSVLAIQICRALLGFRLVAEHPGSVEAASVMPD